MNSYIDTYRKMISLRGLTDHTLKSYCTYISAYLDYVQNVLHSSPEDISWQQMRDFLFYKPMMKTTFILNLSISRFERLKLRSDGLTVSPVILFVMLMPHIFTSRVLTF